METPEGSACGTVQAVSIGGALFLTTINQAPEAQYVHMVHAFVAWAKGYKTQLEVGREVDRPTVGIHPFNLVKYVVGFSRSIMIHTRILLGGPLRKIPIPR